MTSAQSRYLKDLREGFGISRKDLLDLCVAYGFGRDHTLWDDAQVEGVSEMLARQGPEYVRAMTLARQGREEYEAKAARKRKREQQKQAA